jgi:hypothetical protein
MRSRAKPVIPERSLPNHNAHVLAYRWRPQHNAHVVAYRDHLYAPFQDLSEEEWEAANPFPFSVKTTNESVEIGGSEVTNPKGKLITVNDWAKAKGLALSISQATEVGMRAAKLYEAKYGMPPSQVTSRRSPLFTGNFVSDMRRP